MSCNHRVDGNKCQLTNNACVAVYWCAKLSAYKEMTNAKERCKYLNTKDEIVVPDGCVKVEFVRRGKLYMNIDGTVRPYENPFDYVPQFVKVKKTKNGYKFEEYKETK